MKTIIYIFILMLFGSIGYSQSIVNRTTGTNTVNDPNLFSSRSFKVPVYNDTISANVDFPTLDSAGKIIFTRDINWFWGRQTTPNRVWIPFNNPSTQIFPTCGNPNNAHFVTWDSLLVFDVTGGPYVLCCDGIPRATNFTTIILPAADPDNPRIDAIVLNSTGVAIDTGIAAADPAVPQIDSCEILLTYVLINAGQTTPANVFQSVIYDETNAFSSGEATVDTTVNVTMDTLDVTTPVHLLHDINVSTYSVGGYFDYLLPATINLNDYGALKFYLKKTSSNQLVISVIWYLDNQQQTFSVVPTISQTAPGSYQVIVIPTNFWRVIQTSQVNKIRFQIFGGTPAQFYLDWIQLQGGIPPPQPVIQGITSLAVNGNSIISPTVTNSNGPNAIVNLPLATQSPSTLFLQSSTIDSLPYFQKLNLSNSAYFTNTLAETFIRPGQPSQYLSTDGSTTFWQDFENDTTFIKNALYREVDPLSNNDSLTLGYYKRDSAIFRYDTSFIGMNSKSVVWQEGTLNFLKLQSNTTSAYLTVGNGRFEQTMGTATAAANNLTLPNNGNAISITGATQINAITIANWQAGSQAELIFSGTPTVKNATSGGAGTAQILLAGSVDFTAATNDVLSLVYDGSVWHESARKTSGSVSSMLGRNGVQDSVDRIILGGNPLYKNTTINTTSSFGLTISGDVPSASSSATLIATNNSSTGRAINATVSTGGIAISGNATNGQAILGTVTTGTAVYGNASSSGTGVLGQSTSGLAGQFQAVPTTTNTVIPVIDISRLTTTNGANGIGGSIDFITATTTTGSISNQLISKWTDATNATRTSQFSIIGVNSATTNTLLTLSGSGAANLGKYGLGTFTGTPTFTLQVDASGNIIEGSASGASVPINTLLAATGTNTIDNANYAQQWQWNTLSSNSALRLSANSTAAASSTQVLMELAMNGVNANASELTRSLLVSNNHTGTTSDNIGIDILASGGTRNFALQSQATGTGTYNYGGIFGTSGAATNNYGIYVTSSGATNNIGGYFDASATGAAIIVPASGGSVGIGTSTPTSTLHIVGSVGYAYTAQTGTYPITALDYEINCTANTFTTTLPTAVGITGRVYVITNSGAGTITLATTSSQTFANVVATPTTLTLSTLTGVMVMSNGANWIKLNGF